jgi:Domain of unknown function (DU1801)
VLRFKLETAHKVTYRDYPAMTPFLDTAVEAKFASYPPRVRRKMLALRELVFRTAASTSGVGELLESLKWGEPAYLTKNKSGSTVRMDWKAKDPDSFALYFNCQTNLVETFRTMFPRDFVFEGNRALSLKVDAAIPRDALVMCIAASLTYHAAKKATIQKARRSQ